MSSEYGWLTQAKCVKGAVPQVELDADAKAEVDAWCAKYGLRVELPEPTEDEKRALERALEASWEAWLEEGRGLS